MEVLKNIEDDGVKGQVDLNEYGQMREICWIIIIK